MAKEITLKEMSQVAMACIMGGYEIPSFLETKIQAQAKRERDLKCKTKSQRKYI